MTMRASGDVTHDGSFRTCTNKQQQAEQQENQWLDCARAGRKTFVVSGEQCASQMSPRRMKTAGGNSLTTGKVDHRTVDRMKRRRHRRVANNVESRGMNEAPGNRDQSTTQEQHGHAQSAHIQGQPRRTIQNERRSTDTTGVDASAAISKVQPERTVTVRVEVRANRTNEPTHGTQRSKQSVEAQQGRISPRRFGRSQQNRPD